MWYVYSSMPQLITSPCVNFSPNTSYRPTCKCNITFYLWKQKNPDKSIFKRNHNVFYNLLPPPPPPAPLGPGRLQNSSSGLYRVNMGVLVPLLNTDLNTASRDTRFWIQHIFSGKCCKLGESWQMHPFIKLEAENNDLSGVNPPLNTFLWQKIIFLPDTLLNSWFNSKNLVWQPTGKVFQLV